MTEITSIHSTQSYDWEEDRSTLPLHATMQLPGMHADSVQVVLWDFPSSKYFFIHYPLLQTLPTKRGQKSNVVLANTSMNTKQELQQGKS